MLLSDFHYQIMSGSLIRFERPILRNIAHVSPFDMFILSMRAEAWAFLYEVTGKSAGPRSAIGRAPDS